MSHTPARRWAALRLCLACGLVLAILLAAVAKLAAPVSAQGNRIVSAMASCEPSDAGQGATVTVRVRNNSGIPLRVLYVEGFSSPQALRVETDFEPPAETELLSALIEDGESAQVVGEWDEPQVEQGYVGGAIVVTALGVLLPICSDRPVDGDELSFSGPAPETDEEVAEAEATAMAGTLGWLESWRAYSALYVLLHPDVQKLVSFDAMACFYVADFGTAREPTETIIFTTEVTRLSFGPWTWGGNGETYAAAEYDYVQKIGDIVDSEEVTGTAHLVQADGAWRWFFGANPESIATLNDSCRAG